MGAEEARTNVSGDMWLYVLVGLCLCAVGLEVVQGFVGVGRPRPSIPGHPTLATRTREGMIPMRLAGGEDKSGDGGGGGGRAKRLKKVVVSSGDV